MAKMLYSDFYPSFSYLNEYYNDEPLPVVTQTRRQAVLQDDSMFKLELSGKGLTYDLEGAITGGTVDEVRFLDGEGNAVATVTVDKAWDAKTIYDALESGGVDKMLSKLLAGADKLTGGNSAEYMAGYGGNDIINGFVGGDYLVGGAGKDTLNGGKGDDLLDGGFGNDRLTGASGSDRFDFAVGDGQDIVTDFDADGGTGKQDFIGADFAEVDKIFRSGEDTVIDFGDGDTLTLLGVDRKHVSIADFAGG